MKREYVEMPMLEVARYLRRINGRLIRALPKVIPQGKEAYVLLYTVSA